MKPTAEDMARNLEVDLALCNSFLTEETASEEMRFTYLAASWWPAAIRRALAAEAELARRMKQVSHMTDHLADSERDRVRSIDE